MKEIWPTFLQTSSSDLFFDNLFQKRKKWRGSQYTWSLDVETGVDRHLVEKRAVTRPRHAVSPGDDFYLTAKAKTGRHTTQTVINSHDTQI